MNLFQVLIPCNFCHLLPLSTMFSQYVSQSKWRKMCNELVYLRLDVHLNLFDGDISISSRFHFHLHVDHLCLLLLLLHSLQNQKQESSLTTSTFYLLFYLCTRPALQAVELVE